MTACMGRVPLTLQPPETGGNVRVEAVSIISAAIQLLLTACSPHAACRNSEAIMAIMWDGGCVMRCVKCICYQFAIAIGPSLSESAIV